MKIKQTIYRILHNPDTNNRIDLFINWMIICLILFSVMVVILESVDSIKNNNRSFFKITEFIIVSIFTIEYLLRFWSSNFNSKKQDIHISRIRYVFSFVALIDLVAILPFYLPFVVSSDLLFIRSIRLLRIFRLLKLTRYTNAFSDTITVLKSRKEHLLITLTIVLVMLVLLSGIMYLVEHDSQPELFHSIPNTMWWAACTMTTVGYGDIFPITTLGKILASIISILGIGLFAVPAGIISSGYIEILEKKHKTICPKCGHKFIQK